MVHGGHQRSMYLPLALITASNGVHVGECCLDDITLDWEAKVV